jgi:tetratricopeptide (TPR) repeat protein
MAGSNDPQVLLREASVLERAGAFAEAEAAYQRILKRWPQLSDTWYNLGLLQRRAGHYEEALASYQQALNRGVKQPEEVHLNRGVVYSDCLRRPEAAEKELTAALALNPDYLPALHNLANLHEDLGRRESALSLYERILELAPNYYEALARYASLKPIADANDPLVERLRAGIASADANPAARASLGFALGKLLDGCAAYEPAFQAYQAANEQSRLSAGRRGPLYERERQERFVDELIRVFTPAQIRSASRSNSPPPIFICGMFRSGSTLTEQVLAGHSRVTAGGELHFLPELAQTKFAPFPSHLEKMTGEQIEAVAGAYRSSLAKLFPAADRITDKRPDNFLYIGLIKSLFPDARIVHTTRHALDNCLSIYFLHLDHGLGYALDLADIGHYYAQYRRLMAHWKSLYGADILDFDYDAFVREPRPAVEGLVSFCGLEWEEGCMAFERVKNAVRTASVWQVREPLYQRSSGRWRHYASQLAPLEAALRDFIP